MSDERPPRFTPLRQVDRRRLTAMFVLGPVVWLVAIVVAAALSNKTAAIEFGLLIAFASFVGFAMLLLVFYAARRRRELRATHH
jgi:hypothetical protein